MRPIQFSRFHSIDNFPLLAALRTENGEKGTEKTESFRFCETGAGLRCLCFCFQYLQIRQYKLIVATISRRIVAFS